jgi:glucose/arabinose dehydrogenase
MKRPIVALVAAALLASVAISTASAADPSHTVVADGLHSPRGLAFGPNGRLYVAEAGLGSGNPTDGILPGFGFTGSVTEIRHARGAQPSARVLLSGLPSAADEEGTVGPDGISVHGHGNILVQVSLSQEQTGLPSDLVGRLIKVTASGRSRVLANVGDVNYEWSTQHQDLAPNDFKPGDSNPYAVLAVAGGAYVADAGTNTLSWVAANGRSRILAYFPNNALADATPTCIAKGPDGALYVGTLALVDSVGSLLGIPNLPPPHPAATVYRVDPAAADPSDLSTVLSLATPWATGLWPITGCAASRTTFYASEFISGAGPAGPFGDVVAIPFAHPDQQTSLANGGLSFPGGVAVGRDGHVYVSNMSTSAEGQVVRLP